MAEIFEYLEEFSCMNPKVIKLRIKNIFSLSDEQANSIYSKWKEQYMKPKFNSIKKGKYE
jgi:hypothetical protein